MVFATLEFVAGALIGLLCATALLAAYLRLAGSNGSRRVEVRGILAGTRVCEIMEPHVVSIDPATPISEAVDDYFLRHGYTVFPVGNGGSVAGLLHVDHVRDCPRAEWPLRSAQELMEVVDDSMLTTGAIRTPDALDQMESAGRKQLLVVESGRLMGIVTLSTIARFARTRLALATPSETNARDCSALRPTP